MLCINGTFLPVKHGLREAAVKAMKAFLRKVVGAHVLRTDEMQTLLLEASAILNSQPLATLDSRSSDGLEPLTSGHFLHGTGPSALPHDSTATSSQTYSKRWRLNQYLCNELWKRWRSEYLNVLQKRNKWKTPQYNYKPGDVILLKDDNVFTRTWPMGRIQRVYPGTDGIVRAVDVYIKGK